MGARKADPAGLKAREGWKDPDFEAGADQAGSPGDCRKGWEELAGLRPGPWRAGGGESWRRRALRLRATRRPRLRAEGAGGERSQRGGGSGWRQLRAGAECPECTCGGAAAAADFPQVSRSLRAWLAFRGLLGFSAKRPVCGIEWPELRARAESSGRRGRRRWRRRL